MGLPPNERAGIAHSLLQSLPGGPAVYETKAQLAAELTRRMQLIESGEMETFDAEESLRRVEEALERRRG